MVNNEMEQLDRDAARAAVHTEDLAEHSHKMLGRGERLDVRPDTREWLDDSIGDVAELLDAERARVAQNPETD